MNSLKLIFFLTIGLISKNELGMIEINLNLNTHGTRVSEDVSA